MELQYDFTTNAPKELILKYILDPQNLLKYVPAFKDLKQINENTWELEVKWLFTIKLTVKRIIGVDEITYTIEKSEGLIKIKSYLRYIILSPKVGQTTLRILFYYEGPFESIVKKQTEEYYKKGKEMFEKDLQRIRGETNYTAEIPKININVINMQTILAKEIYKNEIEDILTKAMVESVNSKVIALLSDENQLVEITFENGSLVESKGDINSLKNKIKVILKRDQSQEIKNHSH
ncbi:DUF3211 family protein [Sulfurisphaera javensis]|uniref:DUF3211 family protein n=1 Tax=Sulfurisphaera javensis TaxID=2049879 RepID=A0AAT9GN74_9CREN